MNERGKVFKEEKKYDQKYIKIKNKESGFKGTSKVKNKESRFSWKRYLPWLPGTNSGEAVRRIQKSGLINPYLQDSATPFFLLVVSNETANNNTQ
jgi:hypothetical protein